MFSLHQDLSGNLTDVSVGFPGPAPCTLSANMKNISSIAPSRRVSTSSRPCWDDHLDVHRRVPGVL